MPLSVGIFRSLFAGRRYSAGGVSCWSMTIDGVVPDSARGLFSPSSLLSTLLSFAETACPLLENA
jgi:hypothetical protein